MLTALQRTGGYGVVGGRWGGGIAIIRLHTDEFDEFAFYVLQITANK